MLRIKQHKFIWFGIIVLGVILLGMPAVYAQDGLPMPDPAADEANLEDPDFTLSDTDEDFVFTPVKPCRIIDTRKAGGAIGSNSSRSFRVWGFVSPQGGNSAGCDSPVGEPLAVLMNIVAVNSTAPGYLTVWPYGTNRPLAGVLNYSPTDKTDPISNAFSVLTASGDPDIYIYAYKQTHVVADVMGYYSRPERTPLERTTNPTTYDDIPAYGSKTVFSPACPVTYTLTGGGCHFTSAFNTGYNIQGTRGGPNSWACDFTNSTGSAANVEVHAICARIPGR